MLSPEDVNDLKSIVRAGRTPPGFYKDSFGMSPEARFAAAILRRHGVGVHWDGDTGRPTFAIDVIQ